MTANWQVVGILLCLAVMIGILVRIIVGVLTGEYA